MPPASGIELEPGAQGLDFANYFVSYGFLYHQKDMLQDQAPKVSKVPRES